MIASAIAAAGLRACGTPILNSPDRDST